MNVFAAGGNSQSQSPTKTRPHKSNWAKFGLFLPGKGIHRPEGIREYPAHHIGPQVFDSLGQQPWIFGLKDLVALSLAPVGGVHDHGPLAKGSVDEVMYAAVVGHPDYGREWAVAVGNRQPGEEPVAVGRCVAHLEDVPIGLGVKIVTVQANIDREFRQDGLSLPPEQVGCDGHIPTAVRPIWPSNQALSWPG